MLRRSVISLVLSVICINSQNSAVYASENRKGFHAATIALAPAESADAWTFIDWRDSSYMNGVLWEVSYSQELEKWSVRRGRIEIIQPKSADTPEVMKFDWDNGEIAVLTLKNSVWTVIAHSDNKEYVGKRRTITEYVPCPSDVNNALTKAKLTLGLSAESRYQSPANIRSTRREIEEIWRMHDNAQKVIQGYLDAAP